MNGPDPKEFELRFFLDNGFQRRECPKCGRHYCTLGAWETCGEPPCEEYTFIGNSPCKKAPQPARDARGVSVLLRVRGHKRVKRLSIVARWRDDVFFTQASIYDFQPWCSTRS